MPTVNSRLETAIRSLRTRIDQHPRLARFAVFAALLAIVLPPVLRLVPRDTVITYELGAAHAAYTRVRLAYVPEGQTSARILTQNFPGGAPRTFEHEVPLGRGRYTIRARLEGPEEVSEVVRHVEIGRERELTVLLEMPSPFDP